MTETLTAMWIDTQTDVIDCTQADLERGLTPDEIARDRADLNIDLFCRGLAQVMVEQSRAQVKAGAA